MSLIFYYSVYTISNRNRFFLVKLNFCRNKVQVRIDTDYKIAKRWMQTTKGHADFRTATRKVGSLSY